VQIRKANVQRVVIQMTSLHFITDLHPQAPSIFICLFIDANRQKLSVQVQWQGGLNNYLGTICTVV
jgi:hypothetical protein